MRWRKTSEHRVRLNQSWSRNDHLSSPGEAVLDFICGGFMMLMP